MKISYNWLKEYVNIDISAEELSVILTDCGLEVEELANFESVKGGLEGVVIGHVLEVQKHPDADKLRLTQVDIGNNTVLQIVCGAPNVAVGQKVVVATVGTTLWKGEESWEIKKAKIRGVESLGMICAEDELGLGTSHEGIMVLPSDTPVGIPAADYFNIYRDFVFTLGLTPNRVDAASHIGVARDVAAALNVLKNTRLEVRIPDINDFSVDNENYPVEIIIEDTNACPRYTGLTISNLKIAPSPDWIANRLKAAGMRPLNNIVDITNYVMLELGHPLHAFDMKHVKGNKVIVKTFDTPRDFVTLDEEKRALHTEDLMICNEHEPMCIAGVFGGIDAGVSEKTTEIFLESAYFNPVNVRKTSSRHGLKTESAWRFERGTDPSATVFALKRAALLLKDIAGGQISSPVYDVYPNEIHKHTISFTPAFIDSSVGMEIPVETQVSILKDLDFEILKENNSKIEVKAPLAKVDVTRPADIVEEILRIYGYNNVPFPQVHKSTLSIMPSMDEVKYRNIFSEMLVSSGFFEMMTNSLSSGKYYSEEFGFEPDKNATILNGLSSELNTMRRSLVFSGLESIVHNINRKQHHLRMFEFGRIYQQIKNPVSSEVDRKYQETMHLAMFMTGNVFPLNWKYKEEQTDFSELKNQIIKILNRAGVVERTLEVKETNNPLFGYGLSYSLKNSMETLVQFGELSEKALEITECRQNVFFAEFNWNQLLEIIKGQKVKASEPPKFPEVHRDIAMLLDNDTSYKTIEDIVYKNGNHLVSSVRLFDIYKGTNLPEGKKSYAISIVLQDKTKTLTDKETDSIIDSIKTALTQLPGVSIR